MTDRINRRYFMQQAAALGALAWTGSLTGCAARKNASSNAIETLAAHTIDRIENRRVQLNYPRLVGKNSTKDTHGTGRVDLVAIIHTQRGAMGWGTGPLSQKQAEQYTDQLKGKQLTELFDPALGILPGCPKPLDFALHDLAGIILDQPVYKMIGGNKPLAFPCYSGMIYMDDIEPLDNPPGIDRVLEYCQQDYDLGYRQLKLKVGRGHRWMEPKAGMARDIEVTRQVVRAFPDVTLLVDANDGWTLPDVANYFDGIPDVNLLWLEEPFPETVEGFKKLRAILNERGVSTYIADGEVKPNVELLDELIQLKLIDVLLPDTVGFGFTRWRHYYPTLKSRGVTTSPHTWGSQLKTYYTTHLAAAYNNILNIEGVTCDSDDVDWGDYALNDKGELTPSNAPGFGMRLL